MAGYGVPIKSMGAAFGLSKEYFASLAEQDGPVRNAIELGKSKCHSLASEWLFKNAFLVEKNVYDKHGNLVEVQTGDRDLAKFYARTQMRWAEVHHIEQNVNTTTTIEFKGVSEDELRARFQQLKEKLVSEPCPSLPEKS